ncbi:hypothetical protein P9112_011112 [Eukaryota sp. TZLM1-RC]
MAISKNSIIKAFGLRGFTLRSKACHHILQLLKKPSNTFTLDTIIEKVELLLNDTGSPLVTLDVVKQALEDAIDVEHAVNPLVIYNDNSNYLFYGSDTYCFKTVLLSNNCLFSDQSAFFNRFSEQFHILKRSLLNTGQVFRSSITSSNFSTNIVPLSSIATSHSNTTVTTLGLLVQTDTSWQLEDIAGKVQLSFESPLPPSHGFFSEGCWVLVTGKWIGSSLCVEQMSLPPLASRSQVIHDLSAADRRTLLGINSIADEEHLEVMKSNIAAENETIYIFSDVHLNVPSVVDRLISAFSTLECGLAEDSLSPPRLIVLMGNFLKHEGDICSKQKELESALVSFGVQCSAFSQLFSTSSLMFIPGPNDPLPDVLPRPSLPQPCQQAFTTAFGFPNVSFCPSPIRIRYYDKDILFHRDDFVFQLCRDVVVQPEECVSLGIHIAHTLASQRHLCPVSTQSRAIVWHQDSVLRLFPLPDVVVLGDSFAGDFVEVVGESSWGNLPAFGETFSFVSVRPFESEKIGFHYI